MKPPPIHVLGIGFWSPSLPNWSAARAAFRGESSLPAAASRQPAPTLLPVVERRRTPNSVALALEVATQAVAQSGCAASQLPSVFTSAHGDLAITDYVCTTLAEQPLLLSPTKFHNSVHNAGAGYWTIRMHSMAPSSALAAFDRSFAAGFVEAAAVAVADNCPVLLVAYDVEACGALASVTASRGLLGCALVISPRADADALATIAWAVVHSDAPPTPLVSTAARDLQHNAASPALPVFEAIARGGEHRVVLPLDRLGATSLELQLLTASTHC